MITVYPASIWILVFLLQAQPEKPPGQILIHASVRILVLAAVLAVVPLGKRVVQWMRDRRKMSAVVEHEME